MIVVYPRHFEENAPKINEVVFDDEHDQKLTEILSGLYETFVIYVFHREDTSDLNYIATKNRSENLHEISTMIDCRYPSKNLDLLINKFKKIEEVWNSEG